MGVEQPQLNLLYRKQENSHTPPSNLKCMLEYTRSSLKICIIISFRMLFLNTFLMLLLSFFFFSPSVQSISEHQRTVWYLTSWNFYNRLCTAHVGARGYLGVPGGAQAARVELEGAVASTMLQVRACCTKLYPQNRFQAFLERKFVGTLQSRAREQVAWITRI